MALPGAWVWGGASVQGGFCKGPSSMWYSLPLVHAHTTTTTRGLLFSQPGRRGSRTRSPKPTRVSTVSRTKTCALASSAGGFSGGSGGFCTSHELSCTAPFSCNVTPLCLAHCGLGCKSCTAASGPTTQAVIPPAAIRAPKVLPVAPILLMSGDTTPLGQGQGGWAGGGAGSPRS